MMENFSISDLEAIHVKLTYFQQGQGHALT
jgi:hypothetical protein